MIPVVSIVGRSNSGKTTVTTKIIKELKKRGYKIGSIKHSLHDFEIDQNNKDSWKHARAGAKTVLIASPKKIALIKKTKHEERLKELLKYFDDVDLVITEGFKQESFPKIEVFRSKHYKEPIFKNGDDVLAYIVDVPNAFNSDKPVIHWDNIKKITDVIEKKLLK